MSYWSSKGNLQDWADQIEKDVPSSGHAKTVPVELFRCASNIYYEIYNNGGCNLGSDRSNEYSKDAQLQRIASYGIDVSKIEELADQITQEYEDSMDGDYFDDTESKSLCKELRKDGGFMDNMMDEVLYKCQELGYEFKDDEE